MLRIQDVPTALAEVPAKGGSFWNKNCCEPHSTLKWNIMNTKRGDTERTYEDGYRSLGYLFYSIAGCDRSIIRSEIEALKRMVQEHWLVYDTSYDELGVGSARYIDLTFDQALEQRLAYKEAYAIFERDQLKEPHRFDGWTKSLILKTAMEIAKASGSVNRSEVAQIGDLQKLLGRMAHTI